MSGNIEIDSEAFANLGVKLNFDEDAYGNLLSVLHPGFQHGLEPSVSIKPGIEWGMQSAKTPHMTLAMKNQDDARAHGLYRSKERAIDVFARSDSPLTSQTLIHESQHWADHIGGLLRDHYRQDEKAVKARLGGSAFVGLSVGTELTQSGHPIVGAAVGLGTMIGLSFRTSRQSYRASASEVSAMRVANTPEILDAFGNIISYSQL